MNRKAPKNIAGSAGPQVGDPLTLSVTQRGTAPAQDDPNHLIGIQTIQYDPSKTVLIAINITQDEYIGQTELLTQSYGHGTKKDIRASIHYNAVEDGRIVQKVASVRAPSGPVARHTIAGNLTKIITESKVLSI